MAGGTQYRFVTMHAVAVRLAMVLYKGDVLFHDRGWSLKKGILH